MISALRRVDAWKVLLIGFKTNKYRNADAYSKELAADVRIMIQYENK